MKKTTFLIALAFLSFYQPKEISSESSVADIIVPRQKIEVNIERIVEKCECPVPNVTENITYAFNLDRRMGRYHEGIDIKGYFGEPIKSIDNGVVEYAGRMNGYGNTIIVKHSGYYTLYAHGKRRSIEVKIGDVVKKGDTLMLMGSTGHAKGVHLHFEVLDEKKKPVNPILTLKKGKFIY